MGRMVACLSLIRRLPSGLRGRTRACYTASVAELREIYLEKAEENLAAAESEFANRRYNTCAARCYYACFLAAVYALEQAGIRPPSRSGQWSHEFVQAQFSGVLINRRKLFAATLRSTLAETYLLRETADYQLEHVSESRARRALRRTDEFMTAIRQRATGSE